MGIFSKVRESRGRPIHRWNRAELYFTASSRYTTEVFYCYKLRGHMSFFRANLIGLKADRDKKEIGTMVVVQLAFMTLLLFGHIKRASFYMPK